MSRTLHAVAARMLTLLVSVVDLSPGIVRYGIGRDVRTRVLRRPVSALIGGTVAVEEAAPEGAVSAGDASSTSAGDASSTVVLATRSLGTGGVEAVIATLSRLLPSHGHRVVVLCTRGGATAESLAADGIAVSVVDDPAALAASLGALPGPAVVQLHNAPEWFADVIHSLSIPMVPVFHTTDVDLSDADWRAQRVVVDRAAAVIAVSETVRAFCASRLGVAPGRISVVPNGVSFPALSYAEITDARARLATLFSASLDGDAVFASLARYNIQKNIAGLVAAFLHAAERRDDIRLVVAGPIDDWIEYALADSMRRASRHADRVLLLGPSTARTVLAASDAFVLDSFFEGWPIAASEAARAGLPLVLSDAGGASELVGDPQIRGRRVANPAAAGAGIEVSDIRRARRRPFRQVNRDELSSAISAVAADGDSWRRRRDELVGESSWLDADEMVRRHAGLISTIGRD
ncbi:glycosyltransferase family 4 protein [Microbacterium sp. CGR1]|uniref:glycosyltransferase family 4 protein n=1 Tax=Microbacterium sp. CGR1 TaxID=1696072 RepID=UPI003DA1EABE